jgi:hypothetical protein
MQATQVVAATLDGDDNVRIVEVLLERNAARKAQASRTAVVQRVVERPAPAAAPKAVLADDPAPLTSLVKWLAIPAVLALAATGWLWHRARRGQNGKPAGPA